MKAPASEMTSAISRLRKIVTRSGRHRVGEAVGFISLRSFCFTAKCQKKALLFLRCNRGIFRTGLLVPPVETREVTRIPCLAESRSTQIPVWADFTRHGAQVVPKIDDRWTPPEPVAVIDAVNHEARLEHERIRDHRIVLGVGVFLDVEILLNLSLRIRKEWPLGSDGRAEFLQRMVVVGGDRGDLSVRHRDPRIKRREFQMLLVLLWA